MIAFLQPLPVGNAVRALLAPPAGATKTRVLRKTADTFAGPTDPAAAIVFEGPDLSFVDGDQNLQNGVAYFYRDYARIGGSWIDGGFTASATPAASGLNLGPDVLELLRQRLLVGLKAAVSSGSINHDLGYVPVLTAPPQFDGTKFPVVTVHLRSEAPAVRAIGETIGVGLYDSEAGAWDYVEGWLAHYEIEIWLWVIENPDTRIAYRKAIKQVLIGNLPVFEASAIEQVEISQSDIEDFETYSARLYQTVTRFSCLAPVALEAAEAPVSDVTVTNVEP